jgi:hypothetical protein
MDRREMLAGAAMLPSFVLTQEQVLRLIGTFVSPEAEATFREKLANEPKPYDPVAVLEAMRERGFAFKLEFAEGLAFPFWHVDDEQGFHGPLLKGNECSFDFPSAVRWLHRQAAAADPEFAAKWPVPE